MYLTGSLMRNCPRQRSPAVDQRQARLCGQDRTASHYPSRYSSSMIVGACAHISKDSEDLRAPLRRCQIAHDCLLRLRPQEGLVPSWNVFGALLAGATDVAVDDGSLAVAECQLGVHEGSYSGILGMFAILCREGPVPVRLVIPIAPAYSILPSSCLASHHPMGGMSSTECTGLHILGPRPTSVSGLWMLAAVWCKTPKGSGGTEYRPLSPQLAPQPLYKTLRIEQSHLAGTT
ncbi:hypothetical protein V8C42DRAFT_218700 [Trichoderma barbatum]